MEPEHTYYLPGRGRVIGAHSEKEDVLRMLHAAWTRYGHEDPGPFEGVSFLPSAGRLRLAVASGERFDVFDVDPTSLERL